LNKEFGSSLNFTNVDGKVYISPDNLTYDLLLEKYVRSKINLEQRLMLKEGEGHIPQAAEQIKVDIKGMEKNQIWPPSPHELHMNYVIVPPSLLRFFAKSSWRSITSSV